MMARPLAIDMFAGAGGLSLGLEQAGFDLVAAVEIDPIHCATHRYNFPTCKVICRSVVGLSGKEIREIADLGDSHIALVAGGAPCQGFSLIGKRALDDERNRLVAEFVRLVGELKPSYFIFENVKGLTVGPHRQFLNELIEAFYDRSYQVVLPYQVLNAADFGVPQNRQRLFILGALSGEPLPSYPEPVTASRGIRACPINIPLDRPLGPSVWDAIGDIPDADLFNELLESDCVQTEFGEPSHYVACLRGLIIEPNNFAYNRPFDSTLLSSSLRTEHTTVSRMRFATTPEGEVEATSRFLKLRRDGVCNTLRAGTGSERGAFTSPRPIHPIYNRCITNREAARLHGYPDWFRFHYTKWHGFRQIGNSVPPPLARAVATGVARAMGYYPPRPSIVMPLGDEHLLYLDMKSAASYFKVSYCELPKRTRTTAS